MLMLTPLFCTEDMLATLMLTLLTDMLPGFHSPPAPVLMPSPKDLMPPPKELLPMLPMLDMDLDTMVNAMLKLIQLFCTEDMLATLMLMLPGFHSPPAPVLTPSLRDLMPPPKELLPMLPMLAMVLDTMVSVMLKLP